MAESSNTLANLRVYQNSRQLEDYVYELVRTLPEHEFYRLGNDLRRSSAAISHYIAEGHRRFSVGLKLETLHLARTEAQQLQQHLEECQNRGYGDTSKHRQNCTDVTKQLWGLITYFKRKQSFRQSDLRIRAADALVAARSS